MIKGFSFRTTKSTGAMKETIRLIDGILLPYTQNVKKDFSLPKDQNALLIWDAFTGQNTDVVEKRLCDLVILTVNVPKNLTLQPIQPSKTLKDESLATTSLLFYYSE